MNHFIRTKTDIIICPVVIKISEELHKELKKFCDNENLKLNKWCEVQLKDDLIYDKRDVEWRNSPKGSGSD